MIQEEEAGLHNIVEENAFTADDDNELPQSPAPYLVCDKGLLIILVLY